MLFEYRFLEQGEGTPITFYARNQDDIGLVKGTDYGTQNVIWEQGKNPLRVARVKLEHYGEWKDQWNSGKDGVLAYELSPELIVFLNTQRLDELAHDVGGMDPGRAALCRLNSHLYIPNDLASMMKSHDWMGHAQELLQAYESAISSRSAHPRK